jgi:CHAT domain-containing protein
MKSQPQDSRPRLTPYAVLAVLLLAHAAAGQSPANPGELVTGRALEHEMAGAQAHTYEVELRAGEFFQVRVEQKGADVTLRLSDRGGRVVATMDSPNGKEGPETLSFVAGQAGRYLLTVSGLGEQTERGAYSINREAARAATARDKRRAEVERSFVEGFAAARAAEGRAEDAANLLGGVLAGWKELGESYLADLTAREIQRLKLLPEYKIAMEKFGAMESVLDGAHASYRKAQQLRQEGQEKSSLELLTQAKNKAYEAGEQFSRAGELARRIIAEHPAVVAASPALKSFPYFAKSGEVNVATFLSSYFNLLLEPEGQFKYARLAASLSREARAMETHGLDEGDKILQEVNVLQSIALSMGESKSPEAVNYYEQTLTTYLGLKKLGWPGYDNKQEANFLTVLANWHLDQSLCRESPSACNRKAIEYTQRAIALYDSLGDKRSAAFLYAMLPSAYFQLKEVRKAFECADKAIALSETAGDARVTVMALTSKASLYSWLGNTEKSREVIRKSLEVSLSIRSYTEDVDSASLPPSEKRNRMRLEYARLISIAGAHALLGEPPKAVEYYRLSVPVARSLGDRPSEAFSLAHTGFGYQEMQDWAAALDYKRQSAELFREVGDRRSRARDLTDIGIIYLGMGKPAEALESLHAAQLIYNAVGDDDAVVTNTLGRAWYALGNRRLAIFYGKKFVNWIQGERQGLNDFDKATQRGFVSSFEKSIRRLADWLIEEGRFAQAEQVLRMLKEEEFSDFVRRDAREIKGLNERLKLDEREAKVIKQYGLLAERASEIGQAFFALDEKKRQLSRRGLRLSAEEQKRYDELESQQKVANDAFQIFLDKELVKEFGEADREQVEVQYSKQEELRKLGGDTVTLYTVVGEERYRVILTTPSVQVDGKFEIKAEDLNKKVFAFRAALNNPGVDPRPLGKELYDILLKPIEKDLKAAKAKTLIWSLDGTLRYIPLAALSPDGQRYLVEDFQNVLITPKTGLNVTAPDTNWLALGLGVSDKQSVTDPDSPDDPSARIDFEELPGTRNELVAIVRDDKSAGEIGVLPGKRFMDAEFTMPILKDSLTKQTADGKQQFNVIHIASHFRLGSSKYNSFLLLGRGQILTLNDLTGSNIKFGDAELVTLSACNTAFADNTNGKEVDTLAEVIQSQGGKAVLATLWRVADESTSLLMSEFYRIRKGNPKLTKAAALQLAQMAIIEGKPGPRAVEKRGRGATLAGEEGAGSGRPGFPFRESRPYSHPYFWSPFVLFGNWR